MDVNKLKEMSNDDYHAITSSYSASDYKALHKGSMSELLFNKKNKKTSEAMEFGSAFHHYVLENDTFYDEYYVLPIFEPTELDKNGLVKAKTRGWKNTKDHKNQLEAYRAANLGKKEVSREDMERISGMERSIIKSFAADLIYSSERVCEKVLFSEIMGVPTRVKADVILPNRKIIVDLKSTQSANESDFTRDILKYGYDIQDNVYRQAFGNFFMEEFRFMFVAVEKEPPFTCCVYELGHARREAGNVKLSMAINKVIAYTEKGVTEHPGQLGVRVI